MSIKARNSSHGTSTCGPGRRAWSSTSPDPLPGSGSHGGPREGEKPTDDAFIESFNGKAKAERLNARRRCRSDQWRSSGNFMSPDDARSKMEKWRRDDSEVRPHSAIGNNTPIMLMNGSDAMPSSWAQTPGRSPAGWFKRR